MIRSRKLLLPVIALTLAFCATATAGAAQFEASEYPARPHSAASQAALAFETEAGFVTCANTFESTLSEASSTLTLHPEYFLCQAFGFSSATVTTTECDYLLHAGTELGGGNFTATLDVACASGKAIRVTAGTCEIEIKSQSGLNSVNLWSPEGSGSVTATFEAKMAYTVTKDGFLCPFAGTGNKTGGEIEGVHWLNDLFGADLEVN
jgi:hypothetical protein